MITRFTTALVALTVLFNVSLIPSKTDARTLTASENKTQVMTGASFKIAQELPRLQQELSGYISSGGTNTYMFHGQEGEPVRFYTESQDAPIAMTLKTLGGKVLARDITSSTSIPSIYLSLPSEGLYRLEISSKDTSYEGNYSLNAIGGRHYSLKDYLFRGYLSSGVTNTYTFQGQAGEPVRFSIESRNLPTVITLKDAEGNVLARDSARSTNRSSPTISLTLPNDGAYTLEITTEKTSRKGDYILSTRGGIDFRVNK